MRHRNNTASSLQAVSLNYNQNDVTSRKQHPTPVCSICSKITLASTQAHVEATKALGKDIRRCLTCIIVANVGYITPLLVLNDWRLITQRLSLGFPLGLGTESLS
ncbi:hypothetical protein PMIN03_009364 [Paraphaeosphaeria minitans]